MNNFWRFSFQMILCLSIGSLHNNKQTTCRNRAIFCCLIIKWYQNLHWIIINTIKFLGTFNYCRINSPNKISSGIKINYKELTSSSMDTHTHKKRTLKLQVSTLENNFYLQLYIHNSLLFFLFFESANLTTVKTTSISIYINI